MSLTMLTGAPETERIVELNGRGYEQRDKAVVKSDVTPNWPLQQESSETRFDEEIVKANIKVYPNVG